MEKKQLTALTNRIKRAASSLSVMGDFMLHLDIDAMTVEQRKALQAHLATKGWNYKYLDEKLAA